jgi:hypothetical protein
MEWWLNEHHALFVETERMPLDMLQRAMENMKI